MPLLDELYAKRDAIHRLAAEHGVRDVRVFGSVARGEEDEGSDLDLLIDLEKPIKDAFGFLSFQEEMEKLTGRRVDIVFENGVYKRLKPIILAEARPL